MKKYLSIILLAVVSFFFFDTSIFAKSFEIDFDVNARFNYFYEMKNNTSFYQFLLSGNDSIIETMRSYHSATFFPNWYRILTYDEYLDSIYGSNAYPVSNDSSAKYVIFTTTSSKLSLKYVNDRYILSSFDDNKRKYFIYFLDSNGNFLDYFEADDFSYSTYAFEENIIYETNEVEYILSSLYYTDTFSAYSDVDLRLQYLVIDGKRYLVNDSEVLNFWQKISNIFMSDIDINNYSLDYLRTHYYMKKDSKGSSFLGLYNILYYDAGYISLTVPNGYLSKTFSYDERSYLIPNSLTCNSNQSLLYFSSSDVNSVNIINYALNNNNLLNNKIEAFSFKLRKSNHIEALSLSTYVEKYTDYLYFIYSSDNFSSNVMYYNPDCFNVYDAISNVNIEFVNINNNEAMVITPSDQQIFYNRVSDLSSSLLPSTDENDFNLTEFISSSWDGAKTFIAASFKISTLSSVLFSTLPSEIVSILLCGFTVCLVIIIWKIFRS